MKSNWVVRRFPICRRACRRREDRSSHLLQQRHRHQRHRHQHHRARSLTGVAHPPDIEPPEPEPAIEAPPCPPAPPALADPPADVLPPADVPPPGELSPAAEAVGSPPLPMPASPSPAAEQPAAEHKSTHASAGTAQQLRFLISIVAACRAGIKPSFLMLFSSLPTELVGGVRDAPRFGVTPVARLNAVHR